MFSVTRPIMGVWIEAESTVITVSQGIKRPNGAYRALNRFGSGRGVSARRLKGAAGRWSTDSILGADPGAGTTFSATGFGAGSAFGWGRWNACIGLVIDSTV